MEVERIEDRQHNALGFGPTDQEHLAAVGHGLERSLGRLGYPGIRAATMAGGDAAAYRAGLQESVTALQIVGPLFSGVGGILFVGGLVSLCRRRK